MTQQRRAVLGRLRRRPIASGPKGPSALALRGGILRIPFRPTGGPQGLKALGRLGPLRGPLAFGQYGDSNVRQAL